ncbi:hypothetical protein OROMI_015662 [Orobanche minor]
MAIRVHGAMFSPPTMRVLACLHEKGLDYEFVPVDVMGAQEHRNKPFVSINPLCKIPGFQDGDLTLFVLHGMLKTFLNRVRKIFPTLVINRNSAESRAITRYIAHAYPDEGTPLVIIQDTKKMAIVDIWMEVEAHQFGPPAEKLAREFWIKPLLRMATDEAVVKEQEVELAKVLDVYESQLVETKYLCGDTFTLADLHHIPTLFCLTGTRVEAIIDARPRVRAW